MQGSKPCLYLCHGRNGDFSDQLCIKRITQHGSAVPGLRPLAATGRDSPTSTSGTVVWTAPRTHWLWAQLARYDDFIAHPPSKCFPMLPPSHSPRHVLIKQSEHSMQEFEKHSNCQCCGTTNSVTVSVVVL